MLHLQRPVESSNAQGDLIMEVKLCLSPDQGSTVNAWVLNESEHTFEATAPFLESFGLSLRKCILVLRIYQNI